MPPDPGHADDNDGRRRRRSPRLPLSRFEAARSADHGETIHQLIRRRRTKLGLRQADTAREVAQARGRPISASRLSEWERGVRPVPFDWLPALAAALDIPFDELAAAALRSRIQ